MPNGISHTLTLIIGEKYILKNNNNLRKNKQILVRLSQKELELLKRKAKAVDLSNSVFIRRSFKYGVCYRINFESANNILYELSKIGTNINQITRGINTAIIVGEKIEIEHLKETLDLYYKSLKALQITCEQYFENNSIKHLEKITIEN